MKIINVPIEPLEERYSSQWNRWIPEDLKLMGVDFVHLNWVTPLTKEIRSGSFLDVIGTNFYKASQLQQLMVMFEQHQINQGDVIFLNDIWFPGIEMLAYVRDALRIDFKIAGIAHAGTWDPYDFLTQMDMESWAKDLENSWFEAVDFIFVNSRYHKELLLDTRKVEQRKIFVVGYPFKPEEFVNPFVKKENIVVFPHRLNYEKQPHIFDELTEILQPRYPDWSFVKTKDVWVDKSSYYNLLNRAKVAFSCALQETFGIAMVEAVMCGCLPVVPNRLSYKYLYDHSFIYDEYPLPLSRLEWAIQNVDKRKTKEIVSYQKTYFMNQTYEFTGRVVNILSGSTYDEWQDYDKWRHYS